MKKVYLRIDEMLIVCKFHPNWTKIVASMQENPYFWKKGIQTLKGFFFKKMKKSISAERWNVDCVQISSKSNENCGLYAGKPLFLKKGHKNP